MTRHLLIAVFLALTSTSPALTQGRAAQEAAERVLLKPTCASQTLRDQIVAKLIQQGGDYEKATAKWELDAKCEQLALTDKPVHDTADAADSASHKDWIYDARWSSDGTLIATAGRDTDVRVWDANTGKSIRTIEIGKMTPVRKPRYPTHVRMARFLNGDRMLAVAADAHPVRIFDVASGNQVAEIVYPFPEQYSDGAPAIAATKSGLLVIAGSSADLIAYDVNAKSERYRLKARGNDWPRFAISEAAGLLVTTVRGKDRGRDRSVILQIRDLATGGPLWEAEVGGSLTVSSVAFSRDGKQLVAAVDGQAYIYDIASKKLAARVQYYPSFGGGLDITFTADGMQLITGSRHAQLWDIATNTRVHHFGPFQDLLHSTDVSPDGKYLVTGHMGSDGRIWEIATGTFFRRLGKNVYPPG